MPVATGKGKRNESMKKQAGNREGEEEEDVEYSFLLIF